ncbi:unnamed protein product, partial [Rotaria sp. Silwood2]
DHLDQFHPKPTCEYCDKMFASADHLNVHKIAKHSVVTVCCHLKDYGRSNRINRFEMEAHYLTQEHQLAIINCIRNLLNIRINGHFEDESEIILSKLQKVYKTIDILVDGIQTLNNDVERHSNESCERQELIENLTRAISLLKLTCTKSNSSIN